MSERFALKMKDKDVAHDTVVLADFVEIWCDGRWEVLDPTRLAPRSALVRIATGRDAADTAFLVKRTSMVMTARRRSPGAFR